MRCFLTALATPGVARFAGQADPADDTHFSFECEINGKPTIMDGYLGADDRIDFSTRKVN